MDKKQWRHSAALKFRIALEALECRYLRAGILFEKKESAEAVLRYPEHDLRIGNHLSEKKTREANVFLLRSGTAPPHSPKFPITASGVAANKPPSTGITIPEIQRASSLAK